MGYDMYFAAGYERRWEERDESAYFRLNIGGMRVAVGFMRELDMVFDASNVPTRDEWLAIPPYIDDENGDGGPEHREAIDALVGRLAPDERPGIPEHKLFSSNDAWWVRPIEILGALHQYRQAVADNPERVAKVVDGCTWWGEWIDYIERAARDGDGFRVC